MTTLVTTTASAVDDAYALFSPEARMAKSQVILTAPPPLTETPTIIRTIELRVRPFAPMLAKLEAITSLPLDWDSYGAVRITSAATATARAILSDLSLRAAAFGASTLVPFSMAPVATGGINIEWRRSDDALELWIGADGRIELVHDQRHNVPRFQERALAHIPAAISEVLAFAA